jgi:hypothetical protein
VLGPDPSGRMATYDPTADQWASVSGVPASLRSPGYEDMFISDISAVDDRSVVVSGIERWLVDVTTMRWTLVEPPSDQLSNEDIVGDRALLEPSPESAAIRWSDASGRWRPVPAPPGALDRWFHPYVALPDGRLFTWGGYGETNRGAGGSFFLHRAMLFDPLAVAAPMATMDPLVGRSCQRSDFATLTASVTAGGAIDVLVELRERCVLAPAMTLYPVLVDGQWESLAPWLGDSSDLMVLSEAGPGLSMNTGDNAHMRLEPSRCESGLGVERRGPIRIDRVGLLVDGGPAPPAGMLDFGADSPAASAAYVAVPLDAPIDARCFTVRGFRRR